MKNYTLGLDLGTNSIGYACVDNENKEIVKSGVRIFDAAEVAKDGSSLALPRRVARLSRRRLKRRNTRMKKTALLLVQSKFIDSKKILNTPYTGNMWQLRVEALDKKLSNDELSKVIYHIVKTRGFKSSKKETKSSTTEKDDKAKELEKANGSMKQLEKELDISGCRTIAEYLIKKSTSENKAIRNKDGDYSHLIKRDLNEKELKLILETQKNKFNNNLITDNFTTSLFEIFNFQEGMPSFEKDVGKCTFEDGITRAPKDAISSLLFRAYDKLANFEYQKTGSYDNIKISIDNKKELIRMALTQKTVSESNIINLLDIRSEEKKYNENDSDKTDGKKNKKEKIYYCNHKLKDISNILNFKSYHELKEELESMGKWENIKDNLKALDAIVYVIAYLKEYKNINTLIDKDIKNAIAKLNFDDTTWKKLFESLSYDKSMSLSLKAIYKILPYFENDDSDEGITLDKIRDELYPNKKFIVGQGLKYIPAFDFEGNSKDNENKYKFGNINNPVVKRTLSQTRLVINKLIKEYGSPNRINIEFARELGKSFDDRKKIRDGNEKSSKLNASNLEHANELGVKNPVIYRLWKEQNEFCIYSGNRIKQEDLINNMVELDHIIPMSRSFDNSLLNRVLVFSDENQKKGNKTAFEYISSKGEYELETYKNRVNTSSLHSKKKERLLLEVFDDKKELEYKKRHLNDTRFIACELKDCLEKTIKPKDIEYGYIQTLNGSITHILRKFWAMGDKERQEDNRHHATDALILASISDNVSSFVNRITRASQAAYEEYKKEKRENNYRDREKKEIEDEKEKRIERIAKNIKNSIQPPWETFATDCRNYVEEKVFVSRMGRRKVTGQLHKETIKSERQDGTIVKKINLAKIDKKYYSEDALSNYLQNMIDLHIDIKKKDYLGRNKFLYDIILEHARENNFKMDEAFNAGKAPSMRNNSSAKIRHIKMIDSASSEFKLEKMSSEKRKASVDSGDIVRLDLFKDSKGKYFVLPVYVFHMNALPIPEDEKSQFQFSIYKNDYLICSADEEFVVQGEKIKMLEGYYNTYNNATQIIILPHNKNHKSVVKTSRMNLIKKYHVDILGNKHLVETPEKRLTLKEVEKLWKNKMEKGGNGK